MKDSKKEGNGTEGGTPAVEKRGIQCRVEHINPKYKQWQSQMMKLCV